MGSKSRDKGQRGEREAAAELARLFHCEACRGRQYQGGDDSPDVKHSIHGVHFEVKRTEKLQLWKAVEQAVDERGGNIPVVLHRPNGKPWLAIVPLDQLPALVVKLYLQLAENS